VIATSEQYPHIFEALHAMEEETQSLGSLKIPVRDVPGRWEPYLAQVNETLGKLSKTERAPEAEPMPAHVKPNAYLDSEFYSFCNGEYHEMSAMENRDLTHAEASLFLNDAFEGWQLTSDGISGNPLNVARQRRIEWLQTLQQEGPTGLTTEQTQELEKLRLELV
jgi:hypothetical protein